jgi:hypothetical protein
MATAGGPIQGCVALIVLEIDVRSSVRQQSHNIHVTITGSPHQGSISIIVVLEIDFGTPSGQVFSDLLHITAFGRNYEAIGRSFWNNSISSFGLPPSRPPHPAFHDIIV